MSRIRSLFIDDIACEITSFWVKVKNFRTLFRKLPMPRYEIIFLSLGNLSDQVSLSVFKLRYFPTFEPDTRYIITLRTKCTP